MLAPRRRLTALAMLVGSMAPIAGMAAVATSTPMGLQPPQIVEIDYYSDSSRTTVIGGEYKGCYWQDVVIWGQTSIYKTTRREPCG